MEGPKSAFCAGALATLEAEDRPNQMMRIAERIGAYDRSRLDPKIPVYRSLGAWVASFEPPPPTVTVDGETVELEHCGVVDDDCEDPAGYAIGGGGVFGSTDEPTCNPVTDACGWCGSVMCPACRGQDSEDGDPRCGPCSREDDRN